jgi:hypothetical protein
MSLEVLNTLAALTTVAIVAATAIAALIQLRHLRASNQISALLTVGDEFSRPEFRSAMHLIRSKLQLTLEEPLFRDYAAAIAGNLPPPRVEPGYEAIRQAVILVANFYEDLGILIKHGIVDKEVFFDRHSSTIMSLWGWLEPFLAFIRAAANDTAIYENFEFLVVSAKDWELQHPVSYPRGVRHLQLTNPWPIQPLPENA